MRPRSYAGRNRSTPRRTSAPKPPLNTRFKLSENLKRYFKKFGIQTAAVGAVVLILYITSAVVPNFWVNVSPSIHGTLERSIDFVGVYNNSIGRIFPGAVIDRSDENVDTDAVEPYDTDETYEEISDTFEVFRVLDDDEAILL